MLPPSAVPPDAPHTDADDGLGVQQGLTVWLHQLQRLILQLQQQVLSLQASAVPQPGRWLIFATSSSREVSHSSRALSLVWDQPPCRLQL